MKEIDNGKFYSVTEIREMLQNEYSLEAVKNFFEEGRIKGEKIDGEWYANKKAFHDLEQILLREKIFFTSPQDIDLTDIVLKGRILDIGGGGEGVIGQLNQERVVAIDSNENELKDISGNFLKVIMDARDLKFIDNTFDTTTSFFTLMYVPLTGQRKVFEEVYRVLKRKGEFVIWDLIIPNKGINKQRFFGVEIKIKIHKKHISTGYATPWNKVQNLDYFKGLSRDVGFKIIESYDNSVYFFLKLQKA